MNKLRCQPVNPQISIRPSSPPPPRPRKSHPRATIQFQVCNVIPSNLKQYPRIAIEVTERDEDCRMSFGGVDGVFRGVRRRQRIHDCS